MKKTICLFVSLFIWINFSAVNASVSKTVNINANQVMYSAASYATPYQVKDVAVRTYASIDFQSGYKTYCYLYFDLTSDKPCGLLRQTKVYIDNGDKPLELPLYNMSEQSSPNQKNLPHYSSLIYFQTKSDKELKKMISAKKVVIRFVFREKESFDWQIPDDLLAEWKEIFSKDKDAELANLR